MILKHRDRELLRFEWVEPQGVRVLSVNESERKFLPLEMKGVADDESLWSWLRHRTVPKHRNYIQQMLGNIGIVRMDTRSIIEIYNLPVDRLQRIEDFLQNRIAILLEYGDKADEFLDIAKETDSVNHVNSVSCTLQIKESLKADPFITYVEIAELLQVSPSTIARKIKELQEAGEIRRVGADKNGHWEVVYGH